MTGFSYPYSVADFIDQLLSKWTSGNFDVKRFDQNSMLGSGHNIPVELAAPKWTFHVEFADLTTDEMLFLETRQHKLFGQQNTCMLYDPRRRYPKADPSGATLGAHSVVVNSIGSDQQTLSFSGLPANYALNIGDKGQISFGTDSNYFFEISNPIVANSSGTTGLVDVFPHIPISITTATAVNFKKPACKVTIENLSVGSSSGQFASGVSFDALEHI